MSTVAEPRPSVRAPESRGSVAAYGAFAADKALEPLSIERRAPGPKDVEIAIAFCGVCHSDLHTVRSSGRGLSIRAFRAMRSSAM